MRWRNIALVILLPATGVVARAAEPPKPKGGDAASMAQAHQHDTPAPSPAAKLEPRVPVEAKEVTYATLGGQATKGYLARPKGASTPLPGLIVIQEWWGLNDNIRAMTRRLAGEGYTALAVDLYGGKTASDPEQARQLMQAASQNTVVATSNLLAAYDYLVKEQKAPKVGTIGWCFGGGWSLRTALALPDKIDATVIYYGQLVTDPKELAPLAMPILGLFGADDKAIPVEDVKAFEKALKAAGKSVTIKIYDGAGHAFANPSGQGYRAEAAEDAWKRTVEFLQKNLKS